MSYLELDLILSIVFTFIFGSLWHGPICRDIWLSLTNQRPEDTERRMKESGISIILVELLTNCATNFLIKYILLSLDLYLLKDFLILAFILWIGFQVPAILSPIMWQGKDFGLFFIEGGYRLFFLLISVSIIYWF